MRYNKNDMHPLLKAFGALVSFVFLLMAVSCGVDKGTVDERLADASEAMALKDYGYAQTVCDNLAAYISAEDTVAMDERQAGALALLFMELSDHRNEDENVAVAAQCLQYAYKVSADSLRSFSAALPLEEQRHFELLRRITVSIDNPVDLSEEDFFEEGDLPMELH